MNLYSAIDERKAVMRSKSKRLLIIVSVVVILGMLLGACSPAAQQAPPTQAPQAAPTTAPASAAPKPETTPTKPAAAPTAAVQRGGILPVAHPGDAPSLDLIQEVSYLVAKPLSGAYNSLIRHEQLDENKLIADLAKSWEVSKDGLTYTFNLNEGVKWHDGKPFSSADVKYTLDRIRKPPEGTLSARQDLLNPVVSIETPDAKTVKMTLNRNSASMLEMLGLIFFAIYPKHVLEEKGHMRDVAVGTGPFKMKEYKRGISFTFEKNPNYFKEGLPYLDGYTLYIIPDKTARLAAFRAGRVYLDTYRHEPPAIDIIEKEMKDVAIAFRGFADGFNQLQFNVTKKPFSDVRVRQAANLAIDRFDMESLKPGLYIKGGFMKPGGAWALPEAEMVAMPGYAKGEAKEKEREQAKKLLAEAGASGLTLKFLVRKGHYEDQAVFAQDQLAKIGVKCNLEVLETAAYYDKLAAFEWDLTNRGSGNLFDDPDVCIGAEWTTTAGKNYGKYSNKEIDKLYEEQAGQLDPVKRKESVMKMHKILHDDVAAVILHWFTQPVGYYKKVKNWAPRTSHYKYFGFEQAWLEK